MSAGDEWAADVVQRVGAEVKRLRGSSGSAQWLSERCAELGYPIGRATISEIEVGRRKTVSVPELIVLAAALDTSPVCLVYPGPYKGRVEFLPGNSEMEYDAAQWFSALGIEEEFQYSPVDQSEDWNKQTRSLRFSRRIEALKRLRARTEFMALNAGDYEKAAEMSAEYDGLIDDLERELGIADDHA